MSDLLSGLRIDQSVYPGNMSHAHNCAIDAVAEALRNPTDEQVVDIDDVWRTYHYSVADTISGQLKCACGEPKRDGFHRIRVYLAAAAGGDEQESDSTLVWACARCGKSPEQHADPASDCIYMPILRAAGGDDE